MRTPTLLALPTLSLATAGCLATPSDAPVANFEAVWTEFDQHYGGFADRGILGTQMGQNFSKRSILAAICGLNSLLNPQYLRRVVTPG